MTNKLLTYLLTQHSNYMILLYKVLDVKPIVPYLSEYANSLTNDT